VQNPNADITGKTLGILRSILPIALVAALARVSVAQDIFSELSRPIVLGILGLFNISAFDHGHDITVGRLEIPWTGDCAGLNLLVLLLAVAIWLNRNESFNLIHWIRILGMIPAAIIANVCRVFTLIGYRELFYPTIETPQLHYFFGLVWLVPFAFLAMPGRSRHITARIFELLHVAGVIALLAPQTSGPDGLGLTLAVVLSLSHCKLAENISKKRLLLLVLWILSAGAFAVSGMESFWLPWILVCPLVLDEKWITTLPGVIITLSTHPLFALLPGSEIITWVTIAWVAWKFYIVSPSIAGPVEIPPHWNWEKIFLIAGTSLLFLLPFLASSFFPGNLEQWVPPKCSKIEPIPGNGYLITLPGQPDQLGLLWYNPSGTHRHHTLKICLKYSGVDVVPSKEDPEVFTDGTHWFKEFFLQGGKLLRTHGSYVVSTLAPGSAAGVHVIAVCDTASFKAQKFDDLSTSLVKKLYQLIMKEKNQFSSPSPSF